VAAAGGAAATLSPAAADIRVLRLEREGQQAFLVNNERAGAVEFTATFPALGVPEIWDPETGRAAPAGVWRTAPFAGRKGAGTAVALRLETKAAALVVFRAASHRAAAHAIESNAPVEQLAIKGGTGSATVLVSSPLTVRVVAEEGDRRYTGTTVATDPLTAVPLDGDWTFRFDRDGAEGSDRPLGSWTDVDASYSGSAFYEHRFTLDPGTPAGRVWKLDLGEVRDVAEITVNGQHQATRLWAPYRVDVTAALREGTNVVRVRVTNTGANAHGDAAASGLLGPVVLRPERLVRVRLALSRG
jgi:hypothetical protein